MIPALPSVGDQAGYLVRDNTITPPAPTRPAQLVESTFYATEGIEMDERLMPFEPDTDIRPVELAPGVSLGVTGRLSGKPQRPGTFAHAVQLCRGTDCVEQLVTIVVYRNVPWEPVNLAFPGKVGTPLSGDIAVDGGPTGVLPTFSVTDYDKLPKGVSIGPDGHVGGVPVAAGLFEIPVRICVAGNCAGVVVKLIVV
ncbi:hypothetical protein [Nonomuraea typhae]|uniref:Uncharacterized protein n=1 Tax=Nonomuraea typhae TaxID=2603600 RepID=A0ABW7YWE0_9ACTN